MHEHIMPVPCEKGYNRGFYKTCVHTEGNEHHLAPKAVKKGLT